MAEETKETKSSIQIRIYEEDKAFFVDNEKLTKYLALKHKTIPKKHEDLMALVRMELEETLKKIKE